jgi:hypothetical protein
MDALLFHVDQRFIGWWKGSPKPPAFIMRVQLGHAHSRSRGQGTRLNSGSGREYIAKLRGERSLVNDFFPSLLLVVG